MTVRIDVTNKDGSTFSDDKVLSFNLQKDAYTPYGLLHIKLTGSTKDYSNAAEIKFRLGGFTSRSPRTSCGTATWTSNTT